MSLIYSFVFEVLLQETELKLVYRTAEMSDSFFLSRSPVNDGPIRTWCPAAVSERAVIMLARSGLANDVCRGHEYHAGYHRPRP